MWTLTREPLQPPCRTCPVSSDDLQPRGSSRSRLLVAIVIGSRVARGRWRTILQRDKQ